MIEYLAPLELRVLTGRTFVAGQTTWLLQWGIPHKVDGRRVIVSREHIRDWLQGHAVVHSNGLNLGAIK